MGDPSPKNIQKLTEQREEEQHEKEVQKHVNAKVQHHHVEGNEPTEEQIEEAKAEVEATEATKE